MNATEHVGSRIRLYRKMKNITIAEMSSQLHVGISTISKYENGKISIDINTLFDIARILDININQLIDFKDDHASAHKKIDNGNFFKKSDLFFMYQYWARDKKIYTSAIEIIQGPLSESTDNIVIYYEFEDDSNYTKCDYIYNGTIFYSDTYTHINAENINNSNDKFSIIVKTPFHSRNYTAGLMVAISQFYRNPYAVKVVISQNRLIKNDELVELLLENDKDTIQNLKHSNALIIY